MMLYEYDMFDLLSHLADQGVDDVVADRIDPGEGGHDVRFYFATFAGRPEAGRAMKVRVRP